MFKSWRPSAPELGPALVVARAWRHVLNEQSRSADIPFEQAGGDSLQLLKLIFLIEERQGIRLPMEECHVGLRPSALVRLVEAASRPSKNPAKEPPGTVFLIPGLAGESPLEGGFQAACAKGMRVATADLPDWPDMIAPDFTMEVLIQRVAAEITMRAPEGPIRLVGFSLGGHVAFGLARALADAGHEIGFLGILDTNTAIRSKPVARGPAPIRTLRRIRWAVYNFRRAVQRSATADWFGEYTARFLARPGKEWRMRLAARLRRIPLPTSYAMFVNIYLREELRSRLLRVWKTGHAHHLVRISAPAVLFRSEEHTEHDPADLGWGALCANLRVVDVYGEHLSMLRQPYVDDLSLRFIEEAERSSCHRSSGGPGAL
jgi:thioesterase domain-containing protein/acyl carrier protein